MKGNKSIVICGKLERNVLEISKSKVSIPSNGERSVMEEYSILNTDCFLVRKKVFP